MVTKIFEVRDRMTCLAVLAMQLESKTEAERYLLAREGYGPSSIQHSEYIMLIQIAGGRGKAYCDEYDWGNRTMANAHAYIKAEWDNLSSGDVVDIEYILGESEQSKRPEREEMGAC